MKRARQRRSSKGILLAALTSGLLINAARAGDYDIPAGEARETLILWSRVSQIQNIFNYGEIGGTRTAAIKGSFDGLEALIMMLKDTGWIFDPVNDRAIAIVPGPYPPCKPVLGAQAPLPPCIHPL